jgi:hypothetical protein
VRRVLGGDDEEGFGQGARHAVDAHLPLFHRLEQARLGLGRGAVDLVGQQHLGENRAWVEGKTVLLALVHGNAGHVRRQQVAGELDAVEFQAEGQGERMRQRGLADARHVLDQQVAAGQQASEREAHLLVLADHDLADLARGGMQFVEHG